jgi:hypothetical protein
LLYNVNNPPQKKMTPYKRKEKQDIGDT